MTYDANTNDAVRPEAAVSDAKLRQRLMRTLALADPAEIEQSLTLLGQLPEAQDLRRPESGLVMLRGRIGGDGASFNLGEATVSRAAVRIATGEIGFGWRLGRSLVAARCAAVADALVQHRQWQARIVDEVMLPLEARHAHRRSETTEAVAATKVEFFTLARGSE